MDEASKKIRVCHMTSVHSSDDVRIFHKECASLAQAGYEVFLVAPGNNREEKAVNVIGVGMRPKSRKQRMFSFSRLVFEKAYELDCDIYHFHDPELLPYGLKLIKKGKKVIYDSHEVTADQIYDKDWIPKPIRSFLSKTFYKYERRITKRLTGVIAATPHIANSFKGQSRRIATVNNYPILSELEVATMPFEDRENIIAYAGGLGKIRGEETILEAIKTLDCQLYLAGNHPDIENEKVVKLGKLTRCEVNELYSKARVGFVLYLPAKNHTESQPIKLFEYMAAGLPVVASNFPLWRTIIEENNCGICVNPNSATAVSNALQYIISNPQEAEKMGNNGRRAIEKNYTWEFEVQQLLSLYKEIS